MNSCPRNPQLSPTRSGFGLLETVMLIALVAGLLSLSATLLHQAGRIHQHSLQSFQQSQQWQRLGDRLREDVHNASQAQVDGDQLMLELDTTEAIRYRLAEDGLERIRSHGGQYQGQIVGPPSKFMLVQWQLDRSGDRDLLVCRFERQEPERRSEAVTWAFTVGRARILDEVNQPLAAEALE